MNKSLLAGTAPDPGTVNESECLAQQLSDDGTFPNSRFPLLLYRGAVSILDPDPAEPFERLFASNGWGGSWRDGIYPYHHYHSTAHEVLGVFAGLAKVQFGGEERGVIYEVHAGDTLIIPAGVAHRNLGSTGDFGVVGAYPQGQDWDINYGKSGERPQADRNIARVPLPKLDPVYGPGGPLLEKWKLR